MLHLLLSTRGVESSPEYVPVLESVRSIDVAVQRQTVKPENAESSIASTGSQASSLDRVGYTEQRLALPPRRRRKTQASARIRKQRRSVHQKKALASENSRDEKYSGHRVVNH